MQAFMSGVKDCMVLTYWPGWVDQTCCNNKNMSLTHKSLHLQNSGTLVMRICYSTWPVSFFDGYFVGQAPGVTTLLSIFCLYTQYFFILFVTVIHFLHMSQCLNCLSIYFLEVVFKHTCKIS